MQWQSMVWHWLAYAAVSSCLLFAAAVLAVMLIDQPVRRLRIIQWAFVGALLLPFLNGLGAFPQWHLGLFAGATPAADVGMAETGMADTGVANAGTGAPTDAGDPGTIGGPMERHGVGRHPQPTAAKPDAEAARPAVPSGLETQRSSSGVAQPGDDDAPLDLPAIVLLAYGGIAGGMLLWWLSGLLRLLHLKLSSRPASTDVECEFRSIAGDSASARRVRILISERVPAPLTFGWWRPWIVLPAVVCQPGRREALRHCLAHEWDHVQRRDILPWYLATLLQVIYFYQPLFWWLRGRMRLYQDYLADAFAAGQTPAPEDYADFLVQHAKHCSPRYAAALGFTHSKSSLFRRVEMVLDDKRTIEPRCRWWWSIAAGLTAIALGTALTAVRLDAASPADEATAKTESKQKTPQPAKPKAAKSITYSGIVVDRISGKPIPETTVIIERTLSNPPKGMEDWKKITRAKSDANGKYSFTLGPEETAQRSLYIVVDAQHPQYVAFGRGGYAHSMILKNLKMGEKPFYAKIRLWPGKPVTGTVVASDGSPVKGAEVLTYSKHSKAERFSHGGFYTTRTDARGRFRFVAATPGDGVYWITPAGFSPQAHVIPEKRGDVGNVVLQHGLVLKGKVLDAKGKPVPNVRVEARRRGDGEDVDAFLGRNAVANHIGRNDKTNAKGEFTLDELPPGDYTIRIRSMRQGWAHQPLKQVFLRKTVTLRDGERPAPLEIRAVPHVEIHITWRDSKGKPSGGWRTHVFGRMDKGSFFTQSSRVDRKTGHSVVRVPHGLQKTQMSVISNEHASLRWRRKAGDPLRAGYSADLGTLEADVHGFEVIRYVAPILLVKAVDATGKPLLDAKPNAVYVKEKGPKDPNSRFINGVRGDVHFEKQTDGRWRSSQLLPDQTLSVTAVLDGYRTTARDVSLKEGSTKELVFVLKPTGSKKKPAKSPSR